MKTQIAVLRKINEPLEIEEVSIPVLKNGQVLVKIIKSGICHTQLNEIRGFNGEDKYLPHALGHEAGGIVEEIGRNVTKVKVGDHVVLTWIKSSGLESSSTEYKSCSEIINAGAIATFGEHSIISENRIVPIPKTLPFDVAALLGCAIPTGGGVILNQIKPSMNESIAIVGVGGIGLSAILLARVMNCHPIIAIDISDDKLKYAKELGATETKNNIKGNFASSIKNMDYVIDTSGSIQTLEQSFEAIKYGGLLVVVGNPPRNMKFSIVPFDLIRGKKIEGSWGGSTNPDRDIPYYINLYNQGRLPLDKIITNRFKFNEINKAFEMLDKKEILGRGILEF